MVVVVVMVVDDAVVVARQVGRERRAGCEGRIARSRMQDEKKGAKGTANGVAVHLQVRGRVCSRGEASREGRTGEGAFHGTRGECLHLHIIVHC